MFYRFVHIFLIFIWTSSSLAQSANFDFEGSGAGPLLLSNQVAGWTINHGFHVNGIDNCNQVLCCALNTQSSAVINTAGGYIDPVIGLQYPIYSVFGAGPPSSAAALANPQLSVPMSGQRVVRLNSSTSGPGIESMTRTLTVTDSTNILEIAFIMSVTGAHLCCESPGFMISVSTSTCQFVFNTACPNSNNPMVFFSVQTGSVTNVLTNPVYNKWLMKRFDLTAYMGQSVSIIINANRCTLTGHYGYAYVDAALTAGTFSANNMPIPSGSVTIPFCKLATIQSPLNYSTYFWTGPNGFTAASPNVTVFTTGVYTVNMGTGDPCTASTRTVYVKINPSPQIYSSNSSLCPGASAVLSYTGGGISSLWLNTGATTPTLQVNPGTTTTYTLISTDSSGCNSAAYFTQSVLVAPAPTVFPHPDFCVGDTLKISISPAVSYSWQCSNGLAGNTSVIKIKADNLPATLHFTIALTGPNACTATTHYSVQTWEKPIPLLSVAPATAVCRGSVFQLSGAGGSAYSWIGPNNFVVKGEKIYLPTAALPANGVYTLVVENDRKCTSQVTTSLTTFELPQVDINDLKKCIPFCTTFDLKLPKTLESPIIAVQWSLNNQVNSNGDICFKEAGEYPMTVKITDARGCANSLSRTITALPKPLADFDFNPKNPVENNDLVLFSEKSRGVQLRDFKWAIQTPETNLSYSSRQLEFLFEKVGNYPVALEVANEYGCRDTMVKVIYIAGDFSFYIPNAFTPNKDGRNENFYPVLNGVKSFEMQIYNRWGESLFVMTDATRGWDGSFKGKECPQGEYVWQIQMSISNGQTRNLQGILLLIR